MLTLSLIAAAVGLLQTAPNPERPPRPTDEQLLSALLAERPGARLLSSTFVDTRVGARSVCGTAEINGAMEPYSLSAAWLDGQWKLSVTAPGKPDWDADGDIDRDDRNLNTAYRKLALILCRDLNPITPPNGVTWVLTAEPDPSEPQAAPRLPGAPIPPATISGPQRPRR